MSFFFFFFKQKTAYEMRISDWSSDVCSSDLAEPARAPAHPHGPERPDGRAGRAALSRRPRATPDQAGTASTAGGLLQGAFLFLWQIGRRQVAGPSLVVHQLPAAVQIGRASCRERVCHYG